MCTYSLCAITLTFRRAPDVSTEMRFNSKPIIVSNGSMKLTKYSFKNRHWISWIVVVELRLQTNRNFPWRHYRYYYCVKLEFNNWNNVMAFIDRTNLVWHIVRSSGFKHTASLDRYHTMYNRVHVNRFG